MKYYFPFLVILKGKIPSMAPKLKKESFSLLQISYRLPKNVLLASIWPQLMGEGTRFLISLSLKLGQVQNSLTKKEKP